MKSLKTNKDKSNIKHLLGLTYALAASLCMLEYGKPILDQYQWKGEVGEKMDYMDEPVRIAFAKPPKMQRDLPVRKDNTPVKEIVPDNVEVKTVAKELPDFEPLIDFDIPADTIAAPEIDLKPLEGFMLDVQPDCGSVDHHLAKTLEYPKRMRETGINGRVFLEFVIGPDGSIDPESYQIAQSSHPDFSKAVKKAMKNPPACKPGKKLGRTVPTIVRLPVYFKLKS